uniref:Integrase catalytic domain-containing protein n=1 Tax=Fagus sylvatica TaxID=28930 RepID=A0A2N9FTH5_FAGSY
MSFLDAFQGYHQIALRREDQEKTVFITPRGVFCYKVMPFGLKNVGATYQRMVTKMFSKLLGKTVEVYIDDMVVKSVQGTDHLENFRQALFRSSDFSDRISKWGAQLGAYDTWSQTCSTKSMKEYAAVILEDVHWPTEQSAKVIDGRICRRMRLNMSDVWGLDLVRPLPRATGNRQWLIVATNYFTKWVEAEPLARITDSESRKFVWKNKITRFGRPKCLIFDNGTQFDSGLFKKYFSEFGIRNHFSSPAYPQGNGQAESSNKTILNGIKKRLEEVKGRWVEELRTILWTFRTTPRSSTGETPSLLLMGTFVTCGAELWINRNAIKILATPRCSACESSSGLVERYQNPSHARCFACESSSGVAERHQNPGHVQSNIKTLAMLGVSPVNPQVVWRNGIKILATPRCSACESSSGLVKRYQNPSHARCFACKPSSGVAERHQNPGHAQWCGGTASKPWPRLGALPVNPQVVQRNGIKTLAMLGILKSPVYESFIMRQSNINP